MSIFSVFSHPFILPFFQLFIGLIFAWLVIGIISNNSKGRFLQSFKSSKVLSIYFIISLGFAWLGLTIGIFAGNSREPAINTIISSSLTLIGGVIIYLFDKQSLELGNESRTVGTSFYILMICLLSLPISMLYGTVVGAKSRVIAEYDTLVQKVGIEQQEKYNDELLRVNEDSIKVFLDIYKDSVEKNYLKKKIEP